MSHPTWVCGLKLTGVYPGVLGLPVTPYVGVWIETLVSMLSHRKKKSHPTWVCGLKPNLCVYIVYGAQSHPTWVCGLKQVDFDVYWHAPAVTPYVGVWIETSVMKPFAITQHRHTLRGCVD